MIKTDTKYNFSIAENDEFYWTSWDGCNGGELKHKPSGRSIYQMCWLNERGYMAEKVEGEIKTAACAFWSELENLQKQKPPRVAEEYDDPEPEHGVNGYCRKCHSYCYGDCEAN